MLLLALLLIASSSQAELCQPQMTREALQAVISDTRAQYFPELQGLEITLGTFYEEGYHFQAQPIRRTLFKERKNRVYEIQVNPVILTCPPPHDALVAVLVHELTHIVDYTQMSTFKLLGHAVKYVFDRKFHARYERETDLGALKKGIGLGLIHYRNWTYQKLDSHQLALKKRYYLTPDEIQEWMNQPN